MSDDLITRSREAWRDAAIAAMTPGYGLMPDAERWKFVALRVEDARLLDTEVLVQKLTQ